MENKHQNNPVAESERQGIRPGFLGGEGGGEVPSGLDAKRAAQSHAAGDLKSAEDAAEGGLYRPDEGLDGARDAEESGGLYNNSNTSIRSKFSAKGRIKGAMKKGGPVAGVIAAILMLGGFLFNVQSLQPFSLVAQFMETFNSMHVSADTRAARFFKAQMDSGRTKNPIKGNKIFGKTFKISEKQNAELKKQGIEFVDDFEGSGLKVLKYTERPGEVQIVAADDATAKKLNDMDLAKFSTDDVKINAEAMEFTKFYASNTSFFHAYNSGSMTWRGQFANWFGTNTTNFLKNNKLTRNMFQNFAEKKKQADGDGMKVVKETIGEKTKTVSDGGVRVEEKKTETTESTDAEGNKVTNEYSYLDPSESGSSSFDPTNMNESDVKTKLNNISGKFSSAANIGCAVANTIGAINLLVTASEALQIVNLTTAYFEAVDKTKAGFGDDSPINELGIAMNEPQEATNKVIDTVADDGSGITEDGISGLGVKEKITKKSAIESAGIAALYDGGLVNPQDPSVKSFNLTSSADGIMRKFGQSMEAFRDCTIAKAGAAAVGMVVDGIEIAGCVLGIIGTVFTFGASAGACAPLATSMAAKIAIGVGISVALSGLISLITPVVTNMLTRDLVSRLGGEDLGNALTSGANMYQGGVHRASGGSLGSVDKYKQFAISQQQVIAENAREERENLSPFDTTSKYTFMGSIATQLRGFGRANSLTRVIGTGGTVVGSALVALSPTASAYDIAESLPSMEDYEETCPYLASIGAIGDSYCNPYMVTDTNTIEDDPADIIDKVADPNGDGDLSDGGFEENETSDGNVIINKNSRLAKYIVYCDNRSSAFGIPDYNIASEISGSGGGVKSLITNAGNTTIGGNVPIFGDIAEMISDGTQLENYGYISGESCVAGNSVSAKESPDWNEAKYYQRFIEDQSLAESMGLIDKSAVAAFMEEYYEEHPLDNSYEGVLARYSGLDKETVADLLDVFDYYTYIANYDPSDRYAFGEGVEIEEDAERFENENVLAGAGVLLEDIKYMSLRNRSFAA